MMNKMVYKHIEDGNILFNELKSNPINVIKVYSNTCAPCKVLHPQYQQLSERFNFVNFLDINMKSNLVRVSAVPTTLIIKEGVIVEKILGADINELEGKLRSFL